MQDPGDASDEPQPGWLHDRWGARHRHLARQV